MKNILTLLLIFATVLGFSQDKKITGYFVDETNKDTIIHLKHYQIYLLKDLNSDSKAKKIFESKNENLKFQLVKLI